MASEKITFYRTNEDKTEVIEQLPKTVTSQVYDSENEQFLHETLIELTDHNKNDTDKKHIEVVSSVPTNLSDSGILFKVDGSSPDVPSTITVDELNKSITQKVQAANLAYKESYTTLAALQAAYPTGNQYNHVVLSDGMIYTWSKNAWVNTQIQANGTGIIDGTVTPEKTSFLAIGKNLFDKSKVVLGSTLHQSSGAAVPNYPLEFVSAFIEITANEEYHFRGTTRIIYYDSNKNYISYNNMTSPTTYTTRPNTAYIRVSGLITSLNAAQIEKGNAFTGYEEHVNVLHEKLRIQESNLQNKIISRQKLGDTLGDKLDAINLDDYSKLTFTNINNVGIVYGSNATDMYSWDSVDSRKLTFNNTGNATAILQVGSSAYYGASDKHMYLVSDYTILSKSENVTMREVKAFGVRIPSVVGNNVNILKTTDTKQNILELTVPTGSSIVIRFNHMGFIFEENEKDEFSNSSMKNIYETTNLKSDGVYFNYKPLTAKQADFALIANEAYSIASKWKNKVWVSYGDSITANGGWQAHLVSRFGLVHTNRGIGGTQAGGTNANAGWQDSRIDSFPVNVDLITIMFGTNDWSNVRTIGTDNGDTTTYMGAMGVIVRKLVTKYPLARIVLMSPPFRTDSTWNTEPPVVPFATGTNKDMRKYADAVEYLAYKYGCKFVNMWADMGINQINFKSFLANEEWPVHMNANGNKRFAEVMIGKLAEIEPLE